MTALGRVLKTFRRGRVFFSYSHSCMKFKVFLSSGHCHAIFFFFKKLKRFFSYQLNSKNNDLVLFFETMFKH